MNWETYKETHRTTYRNYGIIDLPHEGIALLEDLDGNTKFTLASRDEAVAFINQIYHAFTAIHRDGKKWNLGPYIVVHEAKGVYRVENPNAPASRPDFLRGTLLEVLAMGTYLLTLSTGEEGQAFG